MPDISHAQKIYMAVQNVFGSTYEVALNFKNLIFEAPFLERVKRFSERIFYISKEFSNYEPSIYF